MKIVILSLVFCLCVFDTQASSYVQVETKATNAKLSSATYRSIETGIRHIYNDFRSLFNLHYRNAPKVRNEIFATKKEYLEFSRRFNIGIANHNGFYSSRTNTAYTWNHADPKELMSVVMHESVHRLVARKFKQAPTWLNEGLACYYAEIQVKGSNVKINPAVLRDARVKRLLAQVKDYDVARFVNGSRGGFYGGGDQSYSVAWSLVSFMMSSPQGRQLLTSIHNGLQGRSFRRTPIEQIFEKSYPRGMAGFKENWMRWAVQKRRPVSVTLYH
jgi:hypothetical protein